MSQVSLAGRKFNTECGLVFFLFFNFNEIEKTIENIIPFLAYCICPPHVASKLLPTFQVSKRIVVKDAGSEPERLGSHLNSTT